MQHEPASTVTGVEKLKKAIDDRRMLNDSEKPFGNRSDESEISLFAEAINHRIQDSEKNNKILSKKTLGYDFFFMS